ncbi:MAG TPA: VWA domain-containing protein, partial [Deferrisomatales bacterium]|nr:VWA domain-containing protein [Deferrisomatales bacterium]
PDTGESPTRPQAGASAAGGESAADILVPERPATGGASTLEVLRKKDLRHLLPEEQPAVRAALQAILTKLATRPSRRSRPSARGTEIAFRHTFRRNAPYGADILRLAHKTAKIGKRRLVFVGDVSGSMDTYAGFFLLLAHGLARRDRGAEVYAFSTRLFRLTEFVRDRDATRAVARVAEQTRGWSGGTRLGTCLGQLNDGLARGGARRPSAVIVFSDGWDRGDPDTLQREIVRLKSSVQRILWLNPLLGDPGYQPLSRGMATVLPYVNGFYPAHNLESLVRFSRELVRSR